MLTPLIFLALASQSPDLSVMSFNIRYGTANDGANRWELRRDLVFGVVRSSSPDILAVQEALRFQLDELATAFPEYTEIGIGRYDGKTGGEYAAILYRRERFETLSQGTFWFSDTPDVPGSMHWGNRITRICTWTELRNRSTGRTFFVYNVHLDHESQPSRERSAAALLRRIAERGSRTPVIVTGDFNAGESNPAVRQMTARISSLVDTYRVLHPGVQDVGTFNSFRGDVTGEKIDYVFVSPEWQVVEAAIVRTNDGGRYPSDHFPVTAKVRLVR